jgi:excinuclease ABC subunit C
MIKRYLWLCGKTNIPRLSARKMIKDGSEYFGPYTSVRTVHFCLLELVKSLYPSVPVKYDLQENLRMENISCV